jgi:hypothetical protein
MIDENQQVDVKTNEILDEDISDDELLAIIAEVNLDSKDVLEKIKDVNESTGVALHAADKDHEIGILVGREIKTCVAKEDIDKYQLVKFINEGTDTELLVVPLKTYVKDILTKLEEIDFATSAKQLPDNHQVTANAGTDLNTSLLALESGGNLEKIADDFATESTLSELNDKVESVDDGGITKIQTIDGESQNISELILLELKKINIQLSIMTDNEIKEFDLR